MKTIRNTKVASRRPGTRLPLFVLFPLAFAAAVRAAVPEPVKDHALFVGTSLQIEHNGSYAELVAASPNTVTVLAAGQPRNVPRWSVEKVRIDSGLRISSSVAQIDNLSTRVVQADAGGDRWAADRMQILMNSVQSQSSDLQDGNQRQMDEFQRQAATATTAEAGAGAVAALAAANANGQAGANRNVELGRSISSILPNGTPATAVEVTCELTSPKAAQNAFALVVTEYRASSREQPQYKVKVEALRRLGPKPERLTLTQTGLPPGFILGRVDVHVYADGQELATNLSEQRVDLTGEQALQYLTLNYVASHPKETLPAVPQRIALPVGFKDRVPAALVAQSLYATVGPDGAVQQVASDTAGTAVPDAYVDAVVRKFRYNPALKEGKPVESVVAVRLGDYLR